MTNLRPLNPKLEAFCQELTELTKKHGLKLEAISEPDALGDWDGSAELRVMYHDPTSSSGMYFYNDDKIGEEYIEWSTDTRVVHEVLGAEGLPPGTYQATIEEVVEGNSNSAFTFTIKSRVVNNQT